MNLFRVMMAALLGVTLVGNARAAEPTKDDLEKAAAKADAVSELSFAADLASLGRGDAATGVKSPESLVIAAGMIRRANGVFGGKSEALDVVPNDKEGKPVKGDAIKSVGLAAQVEGLFEEARAMVAKDKARSAAIEALIKDVSGWPTRGSVGGPSSTTRTLNPGETHTFNFTFVGGVQAAVAMTSTGPAKIQFDLVNVGGASLISIKGHNANYNWVPARDKDGTRKFTVTLTNTGARVTTYTLTKN